MTEPTPPAAPEAEPPTNGAIISGAIREAIRLVTRDEAGNAMASGDDVVHGLIDALAFMIARSPYTSTIRERRLYVDEIRAALLEQTAAYQEAATKGADIIVPLKAKAHLHVIDGGQNPSRLILPPDMAARAFAERVERQAIDLGMPPPGPEAA